MKFKDKCDICGNFGYLKGYHDMCLCEYCHQSIHNRKEHEKRIESFKDNKVIINIEQLTIYDFIVTNDTDNNDIKKAKKRKRKSNVSFFEK